MTDFLFWPSTEGESQDLEEAHGPSLGKRIGKQYCSGPTKPRVARLWTGSHKDQRRCVGGDFIGVPKLENSSMRGWNSLKSSGGRRGQSRPDCYRPVPFRLCPSVEAGTEIVSN